ncbi:MAG: VanW family protein [Anaerolineae bacterium]|nr:VanW family protein [Anaerolineae bacterium]
MSQLSQVINLKTLKSNRLWLPISVVAISGGLLVMLVFVILAYQVLYLNRIYPGVAVAGIKAGGLTEAELTTAITARAAEYLAHPITIQANGESWTFTGQELGMRVDVAATVGQAYAVGRRGNLLADMLTQLRLLGTPRQLEPVIVYDTGPSNQVLQRLTEEINYPPRDAQLIIHPDASLEIIPAQRGRQLHLESTRSLLEEALFSKNPQPVQAVTQEILPAIPDVATARQQAENLLRNPIRFKFDADTNHIEWRMEPQIVAGLLEVAKEVDANGKTQIVVEPNVAAFAPYLENFVQAINREPLDAQLAWDDEAHELVVLQESQDGRRLDLEAVNQQLLKLNQKSEPVVQLPISVIPPAVSSQNPNSLGIKELVSESTSYFKGSSPERMHNIALATSKFHGVVIPPGQVFSFNRYLGEVNKEDGFYDSLIIYGDRTAVGIGGGVCQVSTTAFRTAFFGGFEILERWAHGYRVSWYEINSQPGLDATVYTPHVDFKFRNDTGHFLLIQTETDLEAGTATFRFYGTKPEREVLVSEPEITNIVKYGPPVYEKDPSLPQGVTKQVDWPKDGMDVTVTRTVKISDTIIYQDVVVSQYRPWQAVYKVGTGGGVQPAVGRP